jgi:hypothetical protein
MEIKRGQRKLAKRGGEYRYFSPNSLFLSPE